MQKQQNKIKVMHIIHNLRRAGAQEVVRTLSEYLASEGCELVVCTIKDGPLRQEIERLGIKVEVLVLRRRSIIAFPLFIADIIHLLSLLGELVKKYDIEIIQTHLLASLDFLVLLLQYTTSTRVVLWTFHSARFEVTEAELTRHKWLLKPKQYAHRLLYRLAAHFVSGCIAVSEQVKEAMIETIGPIQGKITVICNGVDLKRYRCFSDRALVRNNLGVDEKTQLIALVGTLKDGKGHSYMIEAMASIVSRYPSAHVLFIGDGNLREQLQAQAAALNIESNVHFLGNRSDVPELLAASDIFVLPSLWEGLSMALLEGMASGLPVVASEVSGTVQVMISGETGYLVPPGNVQELAKAIERLLSNPAQAQAMGMAARQRVETTFSAQKQADEHLALYRRLLTSS